MIPAAAQKIISQQIDHIVLYVINRQIPDLLAENYDAPFSLDEVLAKTAVNRRKTAVYALTAPGEHPVWLDTALGEILCHVRTRTAVSPQAPVLLYHHGFAEMPYTSSWRRMIPRDKPFPVHSVCIQAPYHNSLSEPFSTGFASVHHIYQMFAGSLRVMQLLQEQFEGEGAAFTVAGGISWGGITSILYEAFFQRTRAAIPMFSSPNLAQVMWDTAERFKRTMPVSRETVDELFDFTSYYQRCEQTRIFPILGKDDLFFRYDAHASIFRAESLVTLPAAHVGAMWRKDEELRALVLEIMKWAAQHPR